MTSVPTVTPLAHSKESALNFGATVSNVDIENLPGKA